MSTAEAQVEVSRYNKKPSAVKTADGLVAPIEQISNRFVDDLEMLSLLSS